MTHYSVDYQSNGCIQVTPRGYSYRFYRLPYDLLIGKQCDIPKIDGFIVYLLEGKDDTGSDSLYVGTSVNGISNRPISHEDKNVHWENCIVFTSFDESLLNGSIILSLEDRVKCLIDNSTGYCNKTITTSRKATNDLEMDLCDEIMKYFVEVYDMFGVRLVPFKRPKCDYLDLQNSAFVRHTDTKLADYTSLRLPKQLVEMYRAMEDMMRSIDTNLTVQLLPNECDSVAFRSSKTGKIIAFCLSMKNKKYIIVYLTGTADMYSSSMAVPTDPHSWGCDSCKTLMYIDNLEMLSKARPLIEKAISFANIP